MTRNLSLTEELEKLEQSITLTLQEIDHNFSRAHRIVTSSILPIVEKYAENSAAVWEGSKFWKQFFEASANVSLSGYEELEADREHEETEMSQSHGHGSTYATSEGEDTAQGRHGDYDDHHGEDSLLDNGDISGSTPRPAHRRCVSNEKPAIAEYPSPYEALRQELKGESTASHQDDDGMDLAPTTPAPEHRLPDMSMTPSSPFPSTSYRPSTQGKRADPLLHRLLDKNYRLQATPLSTRRDIKSSAMASWRGSDSPLSSPPVAAPQLRPEIFSSPMRPDYTRTTAPRTPGVSIQTPARNKAQRDVGGRAQRDEIDWQSDSDQDADDIYKELGMSPPKTIQFAIPPSRLLQTPGKFFVWPMARVVGCTS